ARLLTPSSLATAEQLRAGPGPAHSLVLPLRRGGPSGQPPPLQQRPRVVPGLLGAAPADSVWRAPESVPAGGRRESATACAARGRLGHQPREARRWKEGADVGHLAEAGRGPGRRTRHPGHRRLAASWSLSYAGPDRLHPPTN